MHEIYAQPAPEVDIKQVKSVEGFENILAEYPVYLTDESKLSPQPFDYLFFPKNEAELAAIVREMSRRKVPTTVAGARTGLVGGCVPHGGALISLERLDQIERIWYDPAAGEWRVRAQTSLSLKSLESMLKSRQFPALERSADPAVQADLVRFKADPHGYFYPPDPTEMSASLGGSVATNASGARTYRYGPTRAWVRGIRVLLVDGEFLDIPRGKYFASPTGKFVVISSQGMARSFTVPDYSLPKTKCASGFYTAPQMDLIDLFIGSEGVLGILTRVDVALHRRENKISIIQFLDEEDNAIALTQALRSDSRLHLDFLEFYSEHALNLLRERQREAPSAVGMPPIPAEARAAIFIELSFDPRADSFDCEPLEQAVASVGASLANSWAGYEDRELERFKLFRHLLPETVNSIIAERKQHHPAIHKLGTDLAVPDEHLEEMWQLYKSSCTQAGLEWCAFGHIGNNHIHVNILPRDMEDLHKGLELYEIFARRAVELGGAVSAEHGIGKIKRKFLKLMYTPEQIEQMKRIKEALDPVGLLNPNDIFAAEVSA